MATSNIEQYISSTVAYYVNVAVRSYALTHPRPAGLTDEAFVTQILQTLFVEQAVAELARTGVGQEGADNDR